MLSKRPINDSDRPSQALFEPQSPISVKFADAERQKARLTTTPLWSSSRKPGAGFLEQVRKALAPGGPAGCRYQSLGNNIVTALWPCVFWLRKNPRYNGTFGRMPETTFVATFSAGQPKSTAARWVRLLITQSLIEYSEHQGRLFVDFACWEDGPAQAHYDRHKQANADQRRTQRARAKPIFSDHRKPNWDNAPSRMPQNTPPATFCDVLPLYTKRPLSASPPLPAPQAPGLLGLKSFSKVQHLNIPGAQTARLSAGSEIVPSRAKDVGHVGGLKKMKTKEGQVALTGFLAMIPAGVDITAKPEPIRDPTLPPKAPRMPYSDIHRRMPDVAKQDLPRPVQGLSREAVVSANTAYGLNLRWSELRRAAFTDDHLEQAAHFVMRSDEAKLNSFGSLEAIVVNAAKMRALGYFRPKPSRRAGKPWSC